MLLVTKLNLLLKELKISVVLSHSGYRSSKA